MPRLREIAAERVARLPAADLGTRVSEAGTADSQTPPDDNPVSWRLLHLFGAFPAVLDRHITEFFPEQFREGRYFGKTLGVDTFSIEATIAGGDKIYAEMQEDALAPGPLRPNYFDRFSGEHEQVIEIIESIRREQGKIYSVNLPNTGQIPNLPPESVVECPAVADGGGLRAIQQRPLSAALVGTLATRFQWVETIVEAAVERSRTKFVQALILDGGAPSLDVAERLADDLLAAHAAHLPAMRD